MEKLASVELTKLKTQLLITDFDRNSKDLRELMVDMMGQINVKLLVRFLERNNVCSSLGLAVVAMQETIQDSRTYLDKVQDFNEDSHRYPDMNMQIFLASKPASLMIVPSHSRDGSCQETTG
ncbi:uncharacterized protein LOC130047761 [Ostrea edulis]|uniref:uncharacterized protein LOC130047761 n=1 Tax=Ostrea edulis TaxID=37623 RepID=UPI0024AF1E19|nr:uncharacterized protein LOC130047761 [Ostrea edulis]